MYSRGNLYYTTSYFVDIFHRLGDTLAHVEATSITKLGSLVYTGRCPRGDGRAEKPLLSGHIHLCGSFEGESRRKTSTSGEGHGQNFPTK